MKLNVYQQMNGKQDTFFPRMKYYSAIKRNEAFIHVTTWVSLANITLSERNQI